MTSFLDPDALQYLPSANHLHDYYTPNCGNLGSARAIQNQLDELQPPDGGLNMSNPLSLSRQLVESPMNADGALMDFSSFDQQFLPQKYNAANPFPQQAAFPPGVLVHRDSGYGDIDDPIDQTGVKDMGNPFWATNEADVPDAEGAK